MAAPRPFRFGVGPSGLLGDRAGDWRRAVAEIELLGYSSLCLGDHLSMMGPLPALAAAAAWSERLALGLMVAGNDYRSPLLLAQEAMTVQEISGGRLELGLGAGWDAADYRRLGLPLDRVGTRIDRLAEAIRIVRLYCAGEPFDFAGEHYRLEGVVPAVRGPRPRLMIGGGGPRILSLAAREADIVGINVPLGGSDLRSSLAAGTTAAARVEAAVETVRDAAGPRLAELELHVNVLACEVATGEDAALARTAAVAARLGVTAADLEDSPFVLIGTADAVVTKLRRLREHLGVSYFTVPLVAAPGLAPLLPELLGENAPSR
ncbi:MAG: TIGR03621 family F420-dependent LLM class oxidoreductase [Solirubrobacterales bacterium]